MKNGGFMMPKSGEIDVRVKLATTDDLENLFALNVLFENETTKERMLASIQENDQQVTCIAFIGDVAVGYCTGFIVKSLCYSEDRADVEALFVREEYRKRGIASMLMNQFEKEIVRRGVNHFHLTIHRKNAAALRLYRSLGYGDTGELLLDKSIPYNPV